MMHSSKRDAPLDTAQVDPEYRRFLDEYYADLYADGSDNNRNHHCTTAIIDYLAHLPSRPETWNCLDIGFGRGALLKYFVSRGWTATGIEIAKTDYQTALEGIVGLDLFFGGYLDFETESRFDLVVDNGTFHHQHPNERAQYLGRIADQLAPGGQFLLTTYHTEDTTSDSTEVIEDGRFRVSLNTTTLTRMFESLCPRLHVLRYIPIERDGRDQNCALYVIGAPG